MARSLADRTFQLRSKRDRDRKGWTPEAASKEIVSIVNKIVEKDPTLSEAADYSLTIANVIELYDLAEKNPRLFRDVIVTVDPMLDDPDRVLEKLSTQLAVASSTVVEVGAGDADQQSVTAAWVLHQRLTRNAEKQRRIGNFFLFIVTSLALLATGLTVTLEYIDGRAMSEEKWASDLVESDWWHWIDHKLIIIIPAIAAMANALSLTMNASAKANALRSSAGAIVKEIYLFRMRIGEYSLLRKGSEGDENVNTSLIALNARREFSRRIEMLFSSVLTGEMATDAMAMGDSDAGTVSMAV